ncbi:MAG: hypothetical protein JXQ83_04645 [Candidatus Glassbacteria bacterium]|nr:hypothetical protein [Candidatus Glassbacteria bacterium]
MVRPLDHVTVIQQMNFAEKLHQDAHTHPEISRQQAEDIQRRQRILEQKRTQQTHRAERSKIHLRDDHGPGGRRRRRNPAKKKGPARRIDLIG